MQIVVVEDEQVPRLYPLTVGRAAYALSCGSFRLIDWLVRLAAENGAMLRGVVRPHLSEVQRLDFPQFTSDATTRETPTLLVNARLVPSAAAYLELKRLIAGEKAAAIIDEQSIAAALIGGGDPIPPPADEFEQWTPYLASLHGKLPATEA